MQKESVFFLSLYLEIQLASCMIDLWTLILNHEEKYRDKLSGASNVYCNTVMLGLEKRRDVFDKNVAHVLKQENRENFNDVDLVFFPLTKMSKSSDHFYVICFNMKTFKIDIIDNIDNGIYDIPTRYGDLAGALIDSFVDYLEINSHPKCYELLGAEPKFIELAWSTKYNSVDCRIFVMRHMETYVGQGGSTKGLLRERHGVYEKRMKVIITEPVQVNRQHAINQATSCSA
nr:ulp1 protease family, C-terminal catalytic domain-containing protein [Tanacetum cinerariifolium]